MAGPKRKADRSFTNDRDRNVRHGKDTAAMGPCSEKVVDCRLRVESGTQPMHIANVIDVIDLATLGAI
jgi:hypothetical protein